MLVDSLVVAHDLGIHERLLEEHLDATAFFVDADDSAIDAGSPGYWSYTYANIAKNVANAANASACAARSSQNGCAAR